ncbi:MAG: hypothetical protein IMZ74_04840 [Actinobacteria bacterium]|nr:hypothetical protein [Actinomycetota bacterium]
MKRLAPAVVAGALIVLWGFLSSRLPAPPVRADIMLSSALVLSLVAVLVWGLLPLHALGRRLPLLTAAALPLAILFVWLGWAPLANVAKVVAAAALGIWIAEELEKLSWIVIVAVVSAAVDVVSVAAGPTKAILDKGPVVVGYFTVAVTWAGYTYGEARTMLGISDVIFLALYLGSARRFGLRVGWSAVAMVVSFLATIAAAMWWTALPALPLLSVAFLASTVTCCGGSCGGAGGRRAQPDRPPLVVRRRA